MGLEVLKRRDVLQKSLTLLVFSALPISGAQAAQIIAVRMWPSEEYTRLTIEHDTPIRIRHSISRNPKPERMVVEIEGMRLTEKISHMFQDAKKADGFISSISVTSTPTTIRILIVFKVDVDPQVFSLKPFENYRYRLVFDIYPAVQRDPLMAIIQKEEKEKDVIGRLLAQVAEGQKRMEENRVLSGAASGKSDAIGDLIAGITSGNIVPMKPEAVPLPAPETPAHKGKPKEPVPAQPAPKAEKPAAKPTAPTQLAAGKKTPETHGQKPRRTLVIAIDPGHGGEDPGAIGKTYKTREKDVVLAISKILYKQFNSLSGFKAVLTRTSDYFVPLNRRVLKARAAKADFFVSVHADAWIKETARGSSVFCLNNKGKVSSSNKWLAQRQNNADLIGGANINTKDEHLAKILMDMSFTAQVSDSLDYGGKILNEISKINRLHKGKVEQANFAVLKAPDIPSVLVETAFLSNPQEEKLLRSSAFQKKVAVAIGNGILIAFNRKERLS